MEMLNEILQYKRSKPVWVCPTCDTENVFENGRCLLCGRMRQGSEWEIPAWRSPESVNMYNNVNQENVFATIPPAEYPVNTGFAPPVYAPEPKPVADNKNSVLVWVIIGATILFLLLLAMIALNSL